MCPYKFRTNPFYEKFMLPQASIVSGYYAFKACCYKLLILDATRYSYHKWYTKKRRPQIDGCFLNILHISDQEKILFIVNKGTTCYWRGYHIFLLKGVCQKWKPQIDGSFLNVLHKYGQEKSMRHVILSQVAWKKWKPKIYGLYLNVLHIKDQEISQYCIFIYIWCCICLNRI